MLYTRSLQNIIGRPNTKDFNKYMARNMIPNCSVTTADIMHAEDIFGVNIGSLQGKTVQKSHVKL